MSDRPDPRDRPPDPAGTQPKHDPDSLKPEHGGPERGGLGPGEHGGLPGPPEPAGGRQAVAARAIPREKEQPLRFQFLLGGLLGVGAVVLAEGVAFGMRRGPTEIAPAGGWSPWR